MASVHKFVLVSRFAPVTLSSSGAVASEAQPDTNQTTASTLTMIFIDFSVRIVCKVRNSLPTEHAAVPLPLDCEVSQSCYKCDFAMAS